MEQVGSSIIVADFFSRLPLQVCLLILKHLETARAFGRFAATCGYWRYQCSLLLVSDLELIQQLSIPPEAVAASYFWRGDVPPLRSSSGGIFAYAAHAFAPVLRSQSQLEELDSRIVSLKQSNDILVTTLREMESVHQPSDNLLSLSAAAHAADSTISVSLIESQIREMQASFRVALEKLKLLKQAHAQEKTRRQQVEQLNTSLRHENDKLARRCTVLEKQVFELQKVSSTQEAALSELKELKAQFTSALTLVKQHQSESTKLKSLVQSKDAEIRKLRHALSLVYNQPNRVSVPRDSPPPAPPSSGPRTPEKDENSVTDGQAKPHMPIATQSPHPPSRTRATSTLTASFSTLLSGFFGLSDASS